MPWFRAAVRRQRRGLVAGRVPARRRYPRPGRPLSGLGAPAVVTFHHESSGDSEDGAAFARAWTRLHDVMETASARRTSQGLAVRGSGAMLGVGETGATDAFRNATAVRWWRDSWAWARENPQVVGVVSYFNSGRNSKSNVRWPLSESGGKLAAYRASLASPVVCRL